MAYGSMFSRLGGLRPNLAGLPKAQNPPKGGDFTLEFDSPVSVTKGPEKGEGGAQYRTVEKGEEETQPPTNRENRAFLPEVSFGAIGGLLAPPKDHVPNQARGPAGKNWEFSDVTADAVDPLMTPELADVYEPYGADMTTSLGLLGESTTDTTMSPDIQQTAMPENKGQKAQIIHHNAWHFPEP